MLQTEDVPREPALGELGQALKVRAEAWDVNGGGAGGIGRRNLKDAVRTYPHMGWAHPRPRRLQPPRRPAGELQCQPDCDACMRGLPPAYVIYCIRYTSGHANSALHDAASGTSLVLSCSMSKHLAQSLAVWLAGMAGPCELLGAAGPW